MSTFENAMQQVIAKGVLHLTEYAELRKYGRCPLQAIHRQTGTPIPTLIVQLLEGQITARQVQDAYGVRPTN